MEKIVKTQNFLMSILSSLLGRKILISFSGLFLLSFVIVHLLGNFSLLIGRDAFNLYAYTLTQNRAVLYVIESILAVGFLSHICLTGLITLSNYKARPQKYKVRKKLGMGTIFSSNMGLSGTIILVFLVIHIKSFRLGEAALIPVPGKADVLTRDIYTLVFDSFKETHIPIIYCIVAILLGGHLSHGLQSAFKSIGLYHTRMQEGLKVFAYVSGVLVALGFSAIALYMYFFA